MASDADYLNCILDRLSLLDGITYRPMMGEYLLYYRERIFGGIYDNRFLIRPVKAVREMMPEAETEIPYEGAKEMAAVSDSCSKEFLMELIEAMYNELPSPKQKKKKQ